MVADLEKAPTLIRARFYSSLHIAFRALKMLARISKWLAKLSGKTFVGNDLCGNSYYTTPHKRLDGSLMEKRWVTFKGDPDPTTVPVEWSSWLSHTRKDAPSPEQMLEMANRRRLMKIKVALLKEEEEKLSFKAKTIKTEGVDMSAESMERFMKQIAKGDPSSVAADETPRSSESTGTGQHFVSGI